VLDTWPADEAWDSLWPIARQQLPAHTQVAAMPLQAWFARILARSELTHTHDVLLMDWVDAGIPPKGPRGDITLRLMNFDDLRLVQALDMDAFRPVWRSSQKQLEIAFQQAAFATIAEDDSGLIGYQISTASPASGHLARLAVHPRAQSQGVGYSLIRDVIAYFARRGAVKLTVNTQSDNYPSLALYEKVGFKRTGEEYPVYQI
jgi:ribosomal protein S18 acetylase RimI-like enzyme